MTLSVQQALEQRNATNHFDSNRPVTDAQLQELLRLATLAPSAYNLQNWSFIAVRSAAAKAQLKAAAYQQTKVTEAPLTLVVCGTLQAHRTLAARLQPSIDAKLLPPSVVESWVAMASGSHEGNAQLQRDEAFRSASLAAMALMLAAQAMGLSTGPMSGFDPAAVAQAFALSPDEVPVMLITLGYAAPSNWAQKPREAVSTVLRTV
jgi:nitroreductase